MTIKIDFRKNYTAQYTLAFNQMNDREKKALPNIQATEVATKDQISVICEASLRVLLEKHKLYLIYLESAPQPKSKLRSFKKMFFGNMEEVGKSNIYQSEIDMPDGKSLMAAIITLNSKNLHFCVQQLLNSNLAFGMAVQKEKRSFAKSKDDMLVQLAQIRLEGMHIFRINLFRAMAKYLTPYKLFFHLHSNGNDEELMDFYAFKDSGAMSLLTASLSAR